MQFMPTSIFEILEFYLFLNFKLELLGTQISINFQRWGIRVRSVLHKIWSQDKTRLHTISLKIYLSLVSEYTESVFCLSFKSFFRQNIFHYTRMTLPWQHSWWITVCQNTFIVGVYPLYQAKHIFARVTIIVLPDPLQSVWWGRAGGEISSDLYHAW